MLKAQYNFAYEGLEASEEYKRKHHIIDHSSDSYRTSNNIEFGNHEFCK
jgi:hypothetical protein